MDVVVNRDYGGFGLSNKAKYMYLKKKYPDKEICCYYGTFRYYHTVYVRHNPEDSFKTRSEDSYYFTLKDYGNEYDVENNDEVFETYDFDNDSIEFRSDKCLVEVVKELKEDSYGDFAELKIVKIPKEYIDNVYISSYDGYENIVENHKEW